MSSPSDQGRTDPLESALRGLGAHLERELAAGAIGRSDLPARVRARIQREDAVSQHTRHGRHPRLRLGLAVAVLALVASVSAIPAARRAVADLLGLRGDRIELRQPSVPVTAALADTLQLGSVVSLDQARTRLPGLLVPHDSAPLGLFARIVADPTRPEVSLVFAGVGGRVTGLVSEWRADAGPFFQKMLGARSNLEPTSVNGVPGVWVTGPDHFFFFTDAQGDFVQERGRLAGNALIWQQGPLSLRIEGDVTKAQALAIAASAR